MSKEDTKKRIKELEREIAELKAGLNKKDLPKVIGSEYIQKLNFIRHRTEGSTLCDYKVLSDISRVARYSFLKNGKEWLCEKNPRKKTAEMTDEEYDVFIEMVRNIIDMMYDAAHVNYSVRNAENI